MYKLTQDNGHAFSQSGLNLNTTTTSGKYVVGTDTLNRPFDYGVVDVIGRNDINIIQVGYDLYSNGIYTRSSDNYGNTWTAWNGKGVLETVVNGYAYL